MASRGEATMSVDRPALPLSPWTGQNEDVSWAECHVHLIEEAEIKLHAGTQSDLGVDQPGWYFSDETYDLCGPFVTREEAVRACVIYAFKFLF